MEEEQSKDTEVAFVESAKEARRAQWALNLLVLLSAVAGAVFFGYVIFTIKPFGRTEPEPINVPTSSVGEKFGMLFGEDETTGVVVALRDIDEAPSYREQLSEVMRKDMAISSLGRVYLLVVRNDGDETVSVDAQSLTAADDNGKSWSAKWLSDVANLAEADANGRMRVAQSAHKFELEKGDERQLYVFIPSTGESLPPSGEDFLDGELRLSDKLRIALKHKEIKVSTP